MSNSSKLSLFARPEHMTLEQWQIALRKQIAEKENFVIEQIPNSYGEFIVSSHNSHNHYKVTYRGKDSEWNYCSCMDFKTSQLGTCKHIEAVRMKKPRIPLELPPYSSVYLSYSGIKREVRLRIGYENREEICEIAGRYFTSDGVYIENTFQNFEQFAKEVSGYNVRIYDDVLEFVSRIRDKEKRSNILKNRYDDREIDSILKMPLYPYQREGVRFAFKNGKAIIADEMGLGKTIQAICTSELYRKENLAENVIVICPTSLKYQWKREIEKFTDADVLVIEGNHIKRMELYSTEATYKIVSYNSICNDIKITGGLSFDLIIMDEVQRLKNWNTQIAKAIRKIDSNYSVILSGTPLENKLEELYSIIQIADQFCLGPYYKFRSEHIMTDDNGKVIGYKNLNSIKDKLKEVLIRRKKSEVQLQLPGRIDKNLLISITKTQMEMHNECKQGVVRIVDKWKRFKFLSETDRLRLMMLLGNMRMLCDSTYILDQKTRNDTKVEEILNIVLEILESTDDKIVIFSQWERMTRIIAQDLDKYGIEYEYLHGGVPSAKRKMIIDNFNDNQNTKVFLSTDAGSVGLNLQAASVIINVDLPWNPAVLEQRIARIWRIGQQKNIQVINLVAKDTIEEGMISRLRFKSAMAQGALDGGDDIIYMDDDKFKTIVDTIGSYLTEEPEMEVIENPQEDEIEEIVQDEDITEDDIPIEEEISVKSVISEETEKSINKGIDFMSKIQNLLSSKSVCNMLIGAMSMEDPEHIQDHISSLEENRKNIEELISIFKSMKGEGAEE